MFRGLNEQQKLAVAAVRGPVCILAGAGSGKTTTITRRIALQIASGAFSTSEILALTFTDKAAKEMGSRLKTLGVPAVRARTFHSEALAQYRQFTDDVSEVLGSKVPILISLVQSLPMPHRFTATRDIATEIEWAKNQLISPEHYESKLGNHRPPIPSELMARVFAAYEKRKAKARLIDFEDLLQRACETLSSNVSAAAEVRERYLAFTVDEYQDVNLLQQHLLNVWVGDRRDLCVVGDDYQSIYGFTGASARYLLEFPAKYPKAKSIELTINYRSTSSILETANSLVPRLGGTSKRLKTTGSHGEPVTFLDFARGEEEIAWILARVRELAASGIPWEEIAILYRINARSEAFEEALSAAGIPYQVTDSPFLRRPGPRSMIQSLRESSRTDIAAAVEEAAKALGYEGESTDAEGEEATRQADLGRLVLIAQKFPAAGTVADYIKDLLARFTQDEDGRGIQLLTYHRAKGKEYDAVFLPRLEQGELPFALSRTEDQVAEERRLLYVGMTRAKRFLSITWARSREGEKRSRPQPSQFLGEMGKGRQASARQVNTSQDLIEIIKSAGRTDSLLDTLKSWRTETARQKQVPAYVVFQDSTLKSIADQKPKTNEDLLSIKGVGPSKVAEYGPAILAIIARDPA